MMAIRNVRYRKEPTTDICLHWVRCCNTTKQVKRTLYAIVKPGTTKILYLGKAYGSSVWDRWQCTNKLNIGKRCGMPKGDLNIGPLIAMIHTSLTTTPKLIDDIERLLLFILQPCGNEKCVDSINLYHRELIVECSGDWPRRNPKTFYYQNELPNKLIVGSE
jgi:hypothetical protein